MTCPSPARIHLLVGSQNALGVLGEGHESFSTKVLGRVTTRTFNRLAPQIHPAPAPVTQPGRAHVLRGGNTHPTQVLLITETEAAAPVTATADVELTPSEHGVGPGDRHGSSGPGQGEAGAAPRLPVVSVAGHTLAVVTFDQTEAEIQAHIDGPVQAAWEWLLAVVDDRDFETAWNLTAPELRRARAHAWLTANPAEEQNLEQLVGGTAPEPLRSRFAAAELRAYAESFGHLDTSQMGAASRPRVIGPDAELVVLAQLGQESKVFTEPTLVHGLTFLMHLVQGRWLVADPDYKR